MKRTNKLIIAALLVIMLLLGIGYAAIQNITLNISGTASADPAQAAFKVMFSGEPTVSDATHVTASVTDDTNATINVSGLTAEGDKVTATYTVQNASTDLSADLSVATTNSNTDYFTIKSDLAKTSLVAGEATTLVVTVELTKIPVSETVSSTIGVQLTAMPVQPGEEGTSEGINGSSQTPSKPDLPTLSMITNDNIGEYIDLGNDVVDWLEEGSTSDDWRILYVEDGTVYAILSDYLPNSTGYAEAAGLNVIGTVCVNSTVDRETLINGLSTPSYWTGLANGINGAEVTGAPSVGLLFNSYSTKDDTVSTYTSGMKINNTLDVFDLYCPNTSEVDKSLGYWTYSPHQDVWMWNIKTTTNSFDLNYSYAETRGLRPVVALPSSLTCENVDNIWVVKN